tara:strand:- start:55 stop:3861 length:3807 start_codon:yes stop_codon:yes gene_type:complete
MAESNIARIIRENQLDLDQENPNQIPTIETVTNPVTNLPSKPTSVDLNSTPVESNIDRIIRENQLGSQVNTTNNKVVDLESSFSKYQDSLTKEDILADNNLMEVVYSSLEARRKPSKIMGNIAYKGATTITGGDTGGEGVFGPRDYRKMKKEKAFEIWQNYQRSFAGGQTVTTANEIAYGMSSDEDIQRRLGAGYYLFDKMDNAFTGEGSWAEMGDAVWDYTKAGVYDPATILSFGIGKFLSFGATKASSAAARSVLIKGYQQYVKNGMTKTAARQAVAKVVAKSAPITAADAMINMGADVAYQSQLIDAGAQEEYSKAQTAFSAAGAMFIPAAYAGSAMFSTLRKSGKMDWAFAGYKQLDDDVFKLGKEEAKKLLDARVDKTGISKKTIANFSSGNKDLLNWEDAKIVAKEGLTKRNEKVTDIVLTDAFYKRFFFGDPENKQKGFWEALKDGGFVVHKTMLEDNTRTGVYGQAIKDYLSDEAAEKSMKAFEKASGEKLGIEYSSKALSDHFINRTSTAGSILWTPSQLSRLDSFNNSGLLDTVGKKISDVGEMIGKDGGNLGLNAKEALEAFGSTKGVDDGPKAGSFGLSIYKRLITSHLSTSGANLKGFGQLVSLNTAADFFTGAANLSQAGFQKVFKGDSKKAAMYYNRAWGSYAGAIRRGASVLSPDLEYDYAVKILEEFPETANKLFRDIAGDGGVNDSLKHFNMDAKGRLDSKGKLINPKATLDPKGAKYRVAKTVDAVTKGAQTISLVRLQDEVTKTWAFGNNVNQAIMREYGVSPEKFFARRDVTLEMVTDKFKTNVLEKATFRTLRETASVNWSTLPTNNAFRSAATWIEYATNKTPIGLLVPFGSFLNTTIATMADLSGLNAIRFGIYNKMLKKELDFVTQEGAESFGKVAAGWTAIGVGLYGANGAYSRIKEGLAYNQDRNNDGSIEDRTFDWPYSTIRLTSQIVAHATLDDKGFKWEEVPADLLRELRMQLGGQSLRDLTDFEKSLAEYGNNIAAASQGNESAIELVSNLTGAIVIPAFSKVVAGASRPLDPINQVYGLLTDANMNPDMRQGPEKWNKGLRYINNLFDGLAGMSSELPTKATPTRGTSKNIDAGKQLLGVRGGQGEPNGIESMLNSAGMSSWRSINFQTEPEVRNYMNKLIAPFLDTAARKALANNPNFYTLSLEKKELIIKAVIKEAKGNVTAIMKDSPIPRSLELVRVIASGNKSQLKKVMNVLGIKGTLSEILEGENPLETLNQIKILMESYEDIWHGDLELD